MPKLRSHFHFHNIEDVDEADANFASHPPNRYAKIAAIGPTTATFLRDSLHVRVDVVSTKPGAQSLACAIKDYDSRG